MNYRNLKPEDKRQELLFESWWLVLLSSRETRLPESNFVVFLASSGDLVFRPEPPLIGKRQYDGFTNFWVKDGKVLIGSWSGYRQEVNLEKMALENSLFTK